MSLLASDSWIALERFGSMPGNSTRKIGAFAQFLLALSWQLMRNSCTSMVCRRRCHAARLPDLRGAADAGWLRPEEMAGTISALCFCAGNGSTGRILCPTCGEEAEENCRCTSPSISAGAGGGRETANFICKPSDLTKDGNAVPLVDT